VNIVPEAKLLGTIIQNDLKWNSNTAHIVKRAIARLVILCKLSEFESLMNDLKTIYISYIRSVLEQSAIVWHTSLTEENINDLARGQKTSWRNILKKHSESYENALIVLSLHDLVTRRNQLCKTFAKRSLKDKSIHFELNDKLHAMQTRNMNTYKITHCNTERFSMSALPQMQRMLNE
jgi:hypothetical protein